MVLRGANEAPTVLLVDDERDVRLLWRLAFELHGGFGAITEAADGGEALKVLEVRSFDVVVTDFSMPGVSGFEIIDAALSGCPSTVVVMVSGTADVGDEAVRRGASAFFDKFESTTDLMPRLVVAVLAEHEASVRSAAPSTASDRTR